jgi:hypothetical protein
MPRHRPAHRYDAKAVACVESIERTLQRLRPDRLGELVAILNAIECNVEEGLGDRVVTDHLTTALMAMGHGPSRTSWVSTAGRATPSMNNAQNSSVASRLPLRIGT